MESALADALIGRTIDQRYLVRSRIAHGGMATVYLATDTRLDRQVALKVMHPEFARDAEFVGRFIGEAKSVARLSHPNIVAVFDQGADGPYPFLAMEYVPGRTLRALLRERGWLPWNEALDVIDPVLAGLAAAHEAGIVHRDVKPENVLITADGRVKVVDFGLARASAAMGQTRAGVIIGSVAYIAPEQVTGAATDARSDVYAAGIMLFEMLTGRQPHTGESPLAVAYSHVNTDVPPVSMLVGGVPPAVSSLVSAATSRDPQRRPPDAGQFLRAVRALRGMPDEGDSLSGAWAADPHATAPGYAPPPGGSHTMVVSGAGGYQDTAFNATGYYPPQPDYPETYPGGGGYRGHRDEPLLQRWLFSKRLALLAAGAAAVLVVGIGGWYLTSGRYSPLPNVDGAPLTVAEQALRQAGFSVRVGTAQLSNSVAKGDVISTSPSGHALPGATVVLTVSTGPRMILIPSVAGKTPAEAAAVLRAHGLTVSPTIKKVGADNAPTGDIAGTDPAVGTLWPQNQPVTLDVVAGLALPSFLHEALSAIQGWAGANHITINPTNVASNQPQGIILSQTPAAGTPITPGMTVNVSVSNGPPDQTVPNNLTGQKFGDVQNTLESLGFKVQGHAFGPGHTVLYVTPTGPQPVGTTINVYYGGF